MPVSHAIATGCGNQPGADLARGEDGQPMVRPPVLWNIELDDVLADSKLIVEAWDADDSIAVCASGIAAEGNGEPLEGLFLVSEVETFDAP